MRILEAASQTGRNGAMIYARRIIPLLRARGHEVWLAARPDSWIAQETAGEATLIATDFSRWPLTELRRVGEICRRERIEVTHSHLTRAAGFCALLRVLHGVPSVAHAHSHQFQLHWYFQKLVVAVSRETLRRHRRWGAALGQRGRVLHNFVDTEKFAPVSSATVTGGGGIDPLRAACGIPADAPVVLQLGELNPRKGQLDALAAAARVRRAHPAARLVFVGAERCQEDYRRALRDAVARDRLEPAVTWLGPREDVAQLLPHATVAILPSRQESFALAGLEAMACGVPLVASNVGGFPEMVADNVTGLLVPSQNVAALADAIGALLDDPARRATLGVAARVRVVAEFSPGPHMARLEALLAEGARG
jgi:glycosyltransferase involved in cell wall biosynthesis